MRRSTVPCSARMRKAAREPLRDAVGRRACGNRQRVRQRRDAVVAGARDDRRERAVAGLEPIGERLRKCCGALAVAAQARRAQGLPAATEASAAAASAQLVSTIGKAPAARSASTTSGAGLSATTTNGPCNAMAGCRAFRVAAMHHAKALLMGRQRAALSCDSVHSAPAGSASRSLRSRKAATTNGLTPTAPSAACIVLRSARCRSGAGR